MRCVTPMFRKYELGNYKNGKIVSRNEVLENLSFEPNYISYCLEKMNAKMTKYKYEQIPCGHCWACNLNYSAQWATRIMYECRKYQHNYFVTLTYNDDWLPIAETVTINEKTYENDGSEIWHEGTLWNDHVHTFINSLRKYFEREYGHTGMKYFYCGEYGETTHRPHYHLILMNCPLNLSQFYDTHIDERFKAHWKSHEIKRYWKFGMIDLAECEWSCCAYVARYCTKKLHKKNNEEYAIEGKLPEFIRMSQGIGKSYYEEHKHEIYEHDELIMKTVKGNIGAFKPPKAWDRLYQEEFPEEWDLIKKSRQKAAERSRHLQKDITDYTDLKKLEIASDRILTKAKMLPRESV